MPNTLATLSWLLAALPAKSGTADCTHTSRIKVSRLIRPNVKRHPIQLASKVPSGMPSDNASGVPIMAIAIARPLRESATMRLAKPASSAHSKPANTPAKKRATIVSA